jgi:hypothetical protein
VGQIAAGRGERGVTLTAHRGKGVASGLSGSNRVSPLGISSPIKLNMRSPSLSILA